MKKMITKTTVWILCILFAKTLFAQDKNDTTLMTIGNENILKSEFLSIYYKNNGKNATINKKTLDEYIDLFINYKLKIKESTELGLDTGSMFKSELIGYRKQLSQPYLVDKEVSEQLLEEAYNRMKYDIRASHIFVKIDPAASPKDTITVYSKIMDIRKRIIKGEDFGKLASELSEDPSALDKESTKEHPAIKGNKGDLGYFTILDMVYPFENAAYNTKVGDVSMPIRTSFGYHLIKVTDKRPAMGKVQVAHIFVAIPKNANDSVSVKAKNKIDEIYEKILKSGNFEEQAKQFSEDKASGGKGGVLLWFGCNRMVPEFIIAVSNLAKKGDISAPIKTPYGWHIIKLIDKKEIGSFEDVKIDLKLRISKDARSNKSKDAIVKKIKTENKFSFNVEARNDFYKVIGDTIFEGKWSINQAKGLNKNMFTLGNHSYFQQDFANYIVTNQNYRTKENIESFINMLFNQFVDESCINYEDSRLDEKYPEFRSVMKEYKEGILLFEITDKKVWSKAVTDSVGLQAFYNINKNNFIWEARTDATIYTCANQAIAEQTKELVKKRDKKKYTDDDIITIINKDSQLNLQIENDKYQKGDNKIIDTINVICKDRLKLGISDFITVNKSIVFVDVHKKLASMPKNLSEARGLITADYQNYLEKKWLSELKKKYPISINQKILSTIK